MVTSTSSFSTIANNLDSVGIYRFVWTITSPLGGCVSRDTVAYQVTCPLPVLLQHFEATKQPNSVLLEWLTAAEQNSWGFDIERSTDSKNWSAIGSVRSNPLQTQGTYSYTDRQPVIGDNFYRLKQKDHDGAYAYSPVRLVKYSLNNGIALYPNPARESVTINGLKGTETLSVYNTNGQLVYSGKAGTTGAVQLTIKHLPAGVYLCMVADQTGTRLCRLSFVKE